MLPGSRSCRNLSCSGIPSWPVGILTPTESHLRPSRLPHSCPTREVAVAPCRRARHRMPVRVSLSGSGRIVCRLGGAPPSRYRLTG
jgi:hypothetical protein